LARGKFNAMLDEYYALRGWDDNGVSTKETFKNLGLQPECQVLTKAIERE
jgi:aldehyde:ferredoxin oxidoreductase